MKQNDKEEEQGTIYDRVSFRIWKHLQIVLLMSRCIVIITAIKLKCTWRIVASLRSVYLFLD